MPEICPYQTRVPANVMVNYAGQIADAYALKNGNTDPDNIPPLPDEIQDLPAYQQAKITETAYVAVDIACLARKLTSEAGSARLRSQDHVKEPSIPREPGAQPRNGWGSHILAENAILRYGRALQRETKRHLRDPALKELRRHMPLERRPVNFSLCLGHWSIQFNYGSVPGTLGRLYSNMDALPDRTRAMSNMSYFYGVDPCDIPDVLRRSMPVIGHEASLPMIVFNKSKNYLKWKGQSPPYDNQNQLGSWMVPADQYGMELEIDSPTLKDELELNRINTGCAALFPVPGLTKVGALKMLYHQQIDILEEQGAWGS